MADFQDVFNSAVLNLISWREVLALWKLPSVLLPAPVKSGRGRTPWSREELISSSVLWSVVCGGVSSRACVMPGLWAHAAAALPSSLLWNRKLVSIAYFYRNKVKENTPEGDLWLRCSLRVYCLTFSFWNYLKGEEYGGKCEGKQYFSKENEGFWKIKVDKKTFLAQSKPALQWCNFLHPIRFYCPISLGSRGGDGQPMPMFLPRGILGVVVEINIEAHFDISRFQ